MGDMKQKLTQLYNSLGLVETKGGSTLIMADCMRFVEQLIVETETEEKNEKEESRDAE